ncbi:9785_t:CDS:2 [Racocetra persica]|uniref:9785_t:CDS:1 n=1 Tax=Racocetra persica TaxID=160502 RepID=A0ACA9L8S4_9GLOM|nr:9785_t:CDS:2 [Racocetra persica]
MNWNVLKELSPDNQIFIRRSSLAFFHEESVLLGSIESMDMIMAENDYKWVLLISAKIEDIQALENLQRMYKEELKQKNELEHLKELSPNTKFEAEMRREKGKFEWTSYLDKEKDTNSASRRIEINILE